MFHAVIATVVWRLSPIQALYVLANAVAETIVDASVYRDSYTLNMR